MMHKQFACFSIWSRYIRYQRCLALQCRTSHASAPATPVKNQCVKPVSACVKQNKINTSLETNIFNMSTYCTIFKHRLPSRLPCDLFSLKQSGRDLWNQWNHKNSDEPGKPTHPSHWAVRSGDSFELKFSLRRRVEVVLATGVRPRCKCHLRTTCAGDRPFEFATWASQGRALLFEQFLIMTERYWKHYQQKYANDMCIIGISWNI